MRFFFILFLGLSVSRITFGQWQEPAWAPPFTNERTSDSRFLGLIAPSEKVHFNLETGFAASSGGFGSRYETYLGASVAFESGKRWLWQAGVSRSQGRILPGRSSLLSEEMGLSQGPFSTQSAYVQGNYFVNPSLRLYGDVLYQVTQFSSERDANVFPRQELHSASFGLEYQVNSNARIGIEIRQYQGSGSPFQPQMGFPVSNSPFHFSNLRPGIW